MNQDLIKKLAEKAGFTAGAERYATPDYQTVEPELLERFAQVIVQECIRIVELVPTKPGGNWETFEDLVEEAGDDLREEFGVGK
jgi:hypothetical protein